MNRFHRFDVLACWYEQYLLTKGYRPRTIADYTFELGFFRRYLEKETEIEDIDELSGDILQRFTAGLYDHSLMPATIHHKCSSLINFFAAIYEENKHYSDLRRYLHLPRTGKKLPAGILTEKEMEQVFAALELLTDGLRVKDLKDAITLRDHAMIEVFYSSGVRRSEIIAMRLGDINYNDGLLRVEGKGGKDRVVPIGAMCMAALRRYVHEGRKIFTHNTSPDYLLLTRRGEQMGYQTVKATVDKVIAFAKIDRHIKVHSLRHTCATHMLNNGADIRYVQEMLGHACLSSTQVYTHVSIKKLQETHRKYHPREKGEEDNDTTKARHDEGTKKSQTAKPEMKGEPDNGGA